MGMDIGISIKNMRKIKFEELLSFCEKKFSVNDNITSCIDICNGTSWGSLYYDKETSDLVLVLEYRQLIPNLNIGIDLNKVKGLNSLVVELMKFLGGHLSVGSLERYTFSLDPLYPLLQVIYSDSEKKIIQLLRVHIQYWFDKSFSDKELTEIISNCSVYTQTIDGYRCIFLIPLDARLTGIENSLHDYLKKKYGLKLDKSKFKFKN